MHRWTAFGSSVRGPLHERDGRPNEDAVACLSDGGGGWAVAAVADGHGHTLAVRADAGSRLAVGVAVDQARAWWEAVNSAEGGPTAEDMAGLFPETVAGSWLTAIESDVRVTPLSPAELARSGDGPALVAHPELAYGTTLLVLVALGSSIVACQVGDGDFVAVRHDGSTLRPLPPDTRLIGTQTTSLASRTVTSDFRAAVVDAAAEAIEVVVAATDGYVQSFVADEGFAKAGRDLAKLLHDVGPGAVEAELAGWLSSTTSEGTGDDASLVILFDSAGLAGRSVVAGGGS